MAFGVSVDHAKTWQDILFQTYPNIREGQQRRIHEAKETGLVRSAFGNIRQTREFTKVVNHPVQGGAAGVLCVALKRVGLNLDVLQPLLTVHDEIDYQAPTRDLDEHKALITRCMSDPIPEYNGFQFPVDLEVGTSWLLE